MLFLPQKYLRFHVEPEYSARSVFNRALEWKAQEYLPFRGNLVQIPAALAHTLWALTQTQDTAMWGMHLARTMWSAECDHTWETGSGEFGEPVNHSPGHLVAVSQFKFTALFGFKPKLLFWHLSYINMQPHILHTCMSMHVCVCARARPQILHAQTHAQIILNVYTEQLEHRSDKAYLIREYSSLNQV